MSSHRGNQQQSIYYGSRQREEDDDFDPEAEEYHPAPEFQPTPLPARGPEQQRVRYYDTSMDQDESMVDPYHQRHLEQHPGDVDVLHVSGDSGYDEGVGTDDSASSMSTDSEQSQEEEEEIVALEEVLQLIVQYEEYKRQQVETKPIRHPTQSSEGGEVSGTPQPQVTPRLGSVGSQTPRSARKPSPEHTRVQNDARIRSVALEPYVGALTEGAANEAQLPAWVHNYNQQQLEKHNSEQQGRGNKAERENDEEYGSAPNTGRLSCAPSTAYTRESSRHTAASSKGGDFLNDEERQDRAERRRLKVEADVASQRTFTPRLSRSGTPRRHQEVPLSKPGKWEDRLYGDYFAHKMQQQNERLMHMHALEDREEVESYIRHCSFKPDLSVTSSYEGQRDSTEGGTHLGNRLYDREKTRQEEAKKAYEQEQKERRAALKRAKTADNSPQIQIFNRGTKFLENTAQKREERALASERKVVYRTQDEIDAKADSLFSEGDVIKQNREELASSLARGVRHETTFHPTITTYASENVRNSDKPAHIRLYDESRRKQSEERQKRIAQSEAETSLLTAGSGAGGRASRRPSDRSHVSS